MKLLEQLKIKAKNLKKDTMALYLAYKRPDVSRVAKILALVVVGYALSPIDLVPDFIPVLGYLDDLVLIPLGVFITVKLIPPHIMQECRTQAEEIFSQGRPVNRIAAFVIFFIWLLIASLVIYKIFKIWR